MKLIGKLLAALSLVLTVAAHAQITSAISGRVTDPSGAAIPNAHLELTQNSTNIRASTTSSSVGDYTFPQLLPDTYSLKATAPNFTPFSRPTITVTVGNTTNVDLQFTVSAGMATIEVTTDAPLLQTGVADIQTNIPGHTVAAIPLNTRNFIQLATLAPGVALPPGTLLPRINGGRPRTNEYLFDGISALQPEPGQVVFFPLTRRHRGVHRAGQQRARRIRPLQRRSRQCRYPRRLEHGPRQPLRILPQ